MRRVLLLAGAALLPVVSSGCINPFAMGLATPVPVQPWVADRIEDRICHSTDYKTPILPPIPPGYRPLCEDPPDRAQILRTMPRVSRGIPYIYEEFRDDIEFTVERLVDHIDPPRFYPLIGPAQLHHCHYKCTVYYTETFGSDHPLPFQCKKRRVETVYIDKDHLHLFATTPESLQSIARDQLGQQP